MHVSQSHHMLVLARQWKILICARWALFQIGFRLLQEIKAKWGMGRQFIVGPLSWDYGICSVQMPNPCQDGPLRNRVGGTIMPEVVTFSVNYSGSGPLLSSWCNSIQLHNRLASYTGQAVRQGWLILINCTSELVHLHIGIARSLPMCITGRSVYRIG